MAIYAVSELSPAAPVEIAFEFDQVGAELSLPTEQEFEAATNAPTAESCDLTEVVQIALRDSIKVQGALASMPRSARSVANAVMLWDGGWIDGASPAARSALAEIRGVIRSTVQAASSDCRQQPQSGPRLMPIAGASDTVLALGSGRWRWDDLAAP